MTTIYTKIHRYEKETDSLIVSFASDETESPNPNDYPPVAVQPSIQFPGITDVAEVHKKLSEIGQSIVVRQKTLEDIAAGKINTAIYENLASTQIIEMNVDD